MNKIASINLSPFGASLCFWVFISCPISFWGYMNDINRAVPSNLSFYQNLSWPVAVNFIFPLFAYVTVRYYYLLPRLIMSLVDLCEPTAPNTPSKEEIYARVTRKLQYKSIAPISLFISAVFTLSIANQLLNQSFTGWMTEGNYFRSLSPQGIGLTGIGIFALFIEFVLMYWVLMFIVQSILLILAIKNIFSSPHWQVRYVPGHKDRCCGFRFVGDIALRIYIGLILLGVYLIIKIYDKTFIQDISLFEDIKSIIFVSVYFLTAPLLFHFSIYRCHGFMRQERLKLLKPVERLYGNHISAVQNIASNEDPDTLIANVVMQDRAVAALRKRIPIYPFRFVFSPVITVLAPVFSLALSVGLVLFKNGVLFLKASYLLGAIPGH